MSSEHAEGQQHPITIYLWIWGLLFVFSAGSYLTDFLDHGILRTFLILLFMILKAGFIVAIFMHMKWERLALIFAILLPPTVLLVLVGLMVGEGEYVESTRNASFINVPVEGAEHAEAPAGH